MTFSQQMELNKSFFMHGIVAAGGGMVDPIVTPPMHGIVGPYPAQCTCLFVTT